VRSGTADSQLHDRSELGRLLGSVDGFLYLGEAWALHEAARTCRMGGEWRAVVEIGSWKGRSTIALASGWLVGGELANDKEFS